MNARAIVAEILRESGMSKAALSRASGVSRSLIDDYLHGRSAPTTPQIERLASAAGCQVETRVRPAVPVPKVPETFVAVLEFGQLFPRKEPKPLPRMGHVWRAARERAAR